MLQYVSSIINKNYLNMQNKDKITKLEWKQKN